MVQKNQEYRLKYRATRSSVRLFACTAHSFTCSALLALLAHFAALTYLLARPLTPKLMAIFSVSFLFWTIVSWRDYNRQKCDKDGREMDGDYGDYGEM